MSVFAFSHAIVRAPGRSVVTGLRFEVSVTPDYEKISHEHHAYVVALEGAGLTIEVLAPLEQYPDSMFVEDPALVFPEGAILLRPGAASRRGEVAEIRAVLQRCFPVVLEIAAEGFADGGDVLVLSDAVLIGLSGRTDRAGADAVAEKLAQIGRKARIVATPERVLHLKTAVALVDEETVLVTARAAESGIFESYRMLLVPAGEEAAANALRVNGAMFVGARFPRTIELLARSGLKVVPLPVTEIGKLDAGLSCMSLRWLAP